MKQLTGTIISSANSTAIVKVDSSWQHPIYKKRITRSHHYPVHTEILVKVGDKVVFAPTRPLSKTKKWRIIEVLKP